MDENSKMNEKLDLETFEGKRLEEVISYITETGVPRIYAIEMIFQQLDAQNYSLNDNDVPNNFFKFFFSFYNMPFWMAIIYIIITSYSITLMPQIYPFIYIRYSFTLLLALFIPGYYIIDIIMPKMYEREYMLKISIGVVISFLMTSIIGYMLISTNLGFKESTIMLTLIMLIFIISLITSIVNYKKIGGNNE